MDRNLCCWPSVFLLPTHMSPDQLQNLDESIPTLTYDIKEADIIVGNITTRERALFELRRRHVATEPLHGSPEGVTPSWERLSCSLAQEKNQSQTVSAAGRGGGLDVRESSSTSSGRCTEQGRVVSVVKLSWFIDSLARNELLPVENYLLFSGRRAPSWDPINRGQSHQQRLDDMAANSSLTSHRPAALEQVGQPGWRVAQEQPARHASLGSWTTASESDSEGSASTTPITLKTTYSCQRRTPRNSPNDEFLSQLKLIRETRMLLGDYIGVRAYSTSIASLGAYPHALRNPRGKYGILIHWQQVLMWQNETRGRETPGLRYQDRGAIQGMVFYTELEGSRRGQVQPTPVGTWSLLWNMGCWRQNRKRLLQ